MHTIRLIALILLLTLPVAAQTGPGSVQPDVPGGVGNLQNAVTSNGNGSAVNVQGFGAAIIVVTITGTGTPVVSFKSRALSSGSYTARYGYLKTDSAKTLVATTSTSGEYYIDCAGDYDVTAPVSGTWSGTVTVTIKRVPATARVGAPSGGGSTSLAIGTTAITGGTSGRVLFDNAGAIGEDADLTFLTDTLTVTKAIIGGGSAITSSGPGGALTALGFTSPGTGVATALGVNVGSAGAVVVNGGAGGTPSSIALTNGSGLPVGGITGLGTGVATFLATPSSANLAAAVTDETGSGAAVFANTPTLVTPVLGAATATSINGNTFTTGTYTLTGTAGKTLNFLKSLTLDGTDGTTHTFPSTSATIARTDAAQDFTGNQSIGLGATAAPTAFTVGDTSTSSPRGIMSWQSNTGTDGARLHLRKSRGTHASPTVIVTGDTLGRIVSTGYDGASFLEMASIDFLSTGTIASTRVPTQILFKTATNAAPSVLTTALTLGADQTVIGASNVGSGGVGFMGAGLEVYVSSATVLASSRFGGAGGVSGRAVNMTSNFGNSQGGILLAGDYFIAWGANNASAGADIGVAGAYLRKVGTASVGVGNAANATPVANTLTVGESSRGGTDSNVAGASGTIQSGTGTGTGTVATLIFQTPTIAASGTTAQSYATRLTLDSTGATLPGVIINTGITADTAHTDSTVCQDTTTHQFYSGSGTLGVCLGTSSARFKNSIHGLNEGLNQILALRPVNYFYDRTHGDSGRRLQYGFTAEETQKVLPVLVGLDSEGKPNSVDMLGMFPVMVKAMQEMHTEIESLKAEIQTLKSKRVSLRMPAVIGL